MALHLELQLQLIRQILLPSANHLYFFPNIQIRYMRAIQGELWLKLIFARIPFLLQYEGAAAEDGRSPAV